MRRILRVGPAISLLISTGYAQISLRGSGSQPPVPINLAPGQIVTLYVSGLKPSPPQFVKADSVPLPTMLAGISIKLAQTNGPPGPFAVPILQVLPLNMSNFDPGSSYTAITIQVPFELKPKDSFNDLNIPQLTISDGSSSSQPIVFRATGDQIQVSAATHSDGKAVTLSNAAQVGEAITVYATGLGSYHPPLPPSYPPNGDVMKAPPATIESMALSYDYRPNASPSKAGSTLDRDPDPYRLYIGTSPGSIGLYQANFIVPPPPPGLTACGNFGVSSNLTVTINGESSFDGIGICVKPPGEQ